MIIGSEKLDAFCRAIDNYDGDDYDEFCKRSIADKANEMGISAHALFVVFDAWCLTKMRVIVNCNKHNCISLDFANAVEPSLGRDVACALFDFGVTEFYYSCAAGGAAESIGELESAAGPFHLRGVCPVARRKRNGELAFTPAFYLRIGE